MRLGPQVQFEPDRGQPAVHAGRCFQPFGDLSQSCLTIFAADDGERETKQSVASSSKLHPIGRINSPSRGVIITRGCFFQTSQSWLNPECPARPVSKPVLQILLMPSDQSVRLCLRSAGGEQWVHQQRSQGLPSLERKLSVDLITKPLWSRQTGIGGRSSHRKKVRGKRSGASHGGDPAARRPPLSAANQHMNGQFPDQTPQTFPISRAPS